MDQNLRQYAIFDGNPHLSPMFVIFLVFGIFLIVTPLGMPLIIAAIYCQVKRRRRWKHVGQAARQIADERAETEAMKAYLSI